METGQFGSLQRIDLRRLWPHEARSFTPWLAENLFVLGDVLGIDLELVQMESGVGSFALDLLLTDVGTDRTVIVENQIEATDHDHLGKLLTYAAGSEAAVAVWIAAQFREEHRQALDWLNNRSDADTEFYGIVVEVLQIDDSRPAPNLRLVSFPNDFHRQTVQRQRGASTPMMERYREFFQQLIDRLREDHRFTHAKMGQPQSWYNFGAGMTGLSYAAAFSRGNLARVELYIDQSESEWNKGFFDTLAFQRATIESELGEQLDWQRLDDKKASRIAISHPGSINDGAAELDALIHWMIEKLLAFREVFGPLLPIVAGEIEASSENQDLVEGSMRPKYR